MKPASKIAVDTVDLMMVLAVADEALSRADFMQGSPKLKAIAALITARLYEQVALATPKRKQGGR